MFPCMGLEYDEKSLVAPLLHHTFLNGLLQAEAKSSLIGSACINAERAMVS